MANNIGILKDNSGKLYIVLGINLKLGEALHLLWVGFTRRIARAPHVRPLIL